MSGNEIEERINREVRRTTPDILDGLMDELGLDASAVPSGNGAASGDPVSKVPIEPERERRRAKNWWRRLALPAAAALILVAIGVFTWSNLQQNVFAVVGLDVNPSIELSIDAHERVLSADAINDDAAVVLEGLDLQGADLDTACYAVIGSMLVKGYLKTNANSILVSISSSDGTNGKALEQRVSEGLSSYMQDSTVDVAIFGQYVERDEELQRFADEHAISLGKAWLIKKLVGLGTLKADEASLLKLSTQELILLAQERNVEAETSIGSSDTSEYITTEKALRIATKDAGLQSQDASNVAVEFDCEGNVLVYEVEFIDQSTKWEYEINARTGEILSVESWPAYEPASAADDDDDWDDADDDDDDWDDDADDDGADDDWDDDADDDGWDDDDGADDGADDWDDDADDWDGDHDDDRDDNRDDNRDDD